MNTPSQGYSSDASSGEITEFSFPDVIKNKRDYEIFKDHVKRIPKHSQRRLEDRVHQGEDFYTIARQIQGWDLQPHLLKLTYSDVEEIKELERKSYLRRLTALHKWMERERNPTYGNILGISVVGKWGSALAVVECLTFDAPMVTADESISGYFRTEFKYEIYKGCLQSIPMCNHQRLDDNLQQGSENFYLIAENIGGWDERAYALKLEWPDVCQIKRTIPKSKFQKLAALEIWMQREPNPTYRNLLAVCVKGEFMAHCVIIELFS